MSLRERGFAAVYDRLLAPAERSWLGSRREGLVSGARGTVLEIGGGTGANLEHYAKAERVVLAEPSSAMRAKLDAKVAAASPPVTVVAAGADAVPYPDGYFDTVVSTLVLCTVPDVDAALGEIRRVLAPDGEFRFLEHVRGERSLAEWQDRLQPAWSWVGVGCHPNRDIAAAIERAGFLFDSLEHFDAPEPIPLVKPHIQGVAHR